MNKVEIITLLLGFIILGLLTSIYTYHRIKKIKITKFIIKGSKEIKKLYHILKSNKYKVIDVNKVFKYKILINDKEIRNTFNIVMIVQRYKKNYICFLNPESNDDLNYEVLFKTRIAGYKGGLIINSETYQIYEYKILN